MCDKEVWEWYVARFLQVFADCEEICVQCECSPLMTSAEVGNVIHFIEVSHLSLATLVIAQWDPEQNSGGSRFGVYMWAQQHERSLTNTDLATATAERLLCQQPRPIRSLALLPR